MLGLFRKINYEIEKRKYIHYLNKNPEDKEMRIGLISWHLGYRDYKQAFEQYNLIKDKKYEGSRLEELLKAEEILKSKGYEV